MRLLVLVEGILLGGMGLGSDLAAKEYSWGRVSVLSSDEQQLTFELNVEWPSNGSHGGYTLDSLSFKLPGAQLTPETGVNVPYTLGASLVLPAVKDVRLEILEVDVEAQSASVIPGLERMIRSKRAQELEGMHDSVGNHDADWQTRIGGIDRTERLSPFLDIASVGWMRQHRMLDLRCHPLKVDRARQGVERLRRIRARLVFGENFPQHEVRKREQRLAMPSFDQIARRRVVNPSELTSRSVEKRGLSKQAHLTDSEPEMILRISLRETGVYQLTAGALASRGMDLGEIDPATFRLYDSDQELPLFVEDGGDGTLGGNDRILFYGEALSDVYSETRSYVLRWGGPLGLRMELKTARTPVAAAAPTFSQETIRFEEDLHYSQNMISEAGEDHWFWGPQLLGPESRDFPIVVNDVAVSSSEPVLVDVALKGLSSISEDPLDHHTRVFLNGTMVSDELWDGNERFVQAFEVSAAKLREGENVIRVEVVGDRPGELDQVFVDWLELTYSRRLVAREGRLDFNGSFGPNRVSGFRNDTIALFDVTDPTATKRLEGFDVRLESQGFRVAFRGDVFPSGRFVALDQFAFLSPTRTELVLGSHWKDSGHQADYLIVTHRSFIDALAPLVERRESQGLTTAVVPVDELYDEFTSGVPTAEAIKAFVKHAYHEWRSPAPRYLLLVGDSTIDPRDIFETGTPNLVPSEITEMKFFGESVSDDGFVLVDGDDFLPDLLVGRFPAESVDDLNAMLQKTLAYESQATNADWNRRVLVVADDDTAVFEELSENLLTTLPEGFESERVFLANYPPGDPTDDIFRQLNEGSLLVNYTGHGSRSTWGIGNVGSIMFENADAAALTNNENLTVVTVANCLNGFFVARATKPCLAETFLRNSTGGAVAVWAPTSLGFPSGHRVLVGNFYQSIFEAGEIELGAAVLGAKVFTLTDAGFFSDQVKSYTFFGDPALKLAVPNRIQDVFVRIESGADGGVLLRFDVEPGRNYVVEAADVLSENMTWQSLPGAPHNSGEMALSLESERQFFRVSVSLSLPQEGQANQ